jgi:uncharacterized membrane protein
MVTAGHPADDQIFVARLTPYRSMTERGFLRFIVGFCCVNILISLPFFFMGAWPVAGFMGLDALALYVAFKVNFRAAGAYETLELTPVELVLEKVSATGRRKVWRFNPAWVRLEQEAHREFGVLRLALAARGERIELGGFLGPEQKATLARDFGRALLLAQRGPRFE